LEEMRAHLAQAPVLVLMFAVVSFFAACGSQYAGSSLGEQVHSWATTSPDPKFATAVSNIRGDFHKVVASRSTGDMALVRTVCDVLVTDALEANQNLPSPDTRLTNLLSVSYGSAVSAGQDCFCAAGGRPCRLGTSSSDVLFRRSELEASHADRGLTEAQARVDYLTITSGGPRR
jgi:hypothetical protein